MPADYAQIREENIRRYGTETAHLALLGDLYSDRTHFIFELLQNAEDARATLVRFRLCASGLELSHDGRLFTCDDVRGISSVCQSTSRGEPERIGRFGIGFKSVYAYTRRPEIHSGDEHFCIEHYVRPQLAEIREPGAGLTTLIVLPFDESTVHPAVAKREITQAFQLLDPLTLLFLRHVKHIELNADGILLLSFERRQTSYISPWVRFVELGCSENVDAEQKWLIFERPVKLSDPTGRDVLTRVELAFELTPASSKDAFQIVPREFAALAVFFPTEWKTETGFIIQGPYVPTPARDNIRKNHPTNRLLVEETSKLLADGLRWLRDRRALTVGMLNTLPIKRTEFPEGTLLRPLFEHVLETIKAQTLLPAYTQESRPQVYVEGCRAVAPSSATLRELLGDELLAELTGDQSCKWLADGMTVKGSSDLSKYLREDVGVREISARDFVNWLCTKDGAWWKKLDVAWLVKCYRYLHTQTAEHPALKKLPIVRLESGEHIVPTDAPVFFPADNALEKEELAPFLKQLPIVSQSLLNNNKDNTVEPFLRQMGVAPLVASQFIQKYLVLLYSKPKEITRAENRSHLRFLKRTLSRMSPEDLKTAISELQQIRVLISNRIDDRDTKYWAIPTEAYIPATYTNDGNLEVFLQSTPTALVIDNGYISEGEDPNDWKQFFIQLGAAALPRVIEAEEWHTKDRTVDGLKAALKAVSEQTLETRAELAGAIWSVVCCLLPRDGDYSEYAWDRFIHGIEEIYGPKGGRKGSREIDASFYVALRDMVWMPDEAGQPHRPGELFEFSKYKRQLLGDSVFYLHNRITIKNRKEEWLATKLGIRRVATKDSVIKRLRVLQTTAVQVDDVKPIYEFLDGNRADVKDTFQLEPLIFNPNHEPNWIRPSQAFWEDESATFGLTRGYLKKIYPTLREFFVRVSVAINAGPSDYASALLEIAAIGVTEKATRSRYNRICKRLVDRVEEDGDWKNEQGWQAIWERLLKGDNWLGQCGDTYTFTSLKKIFRKDNEHLASLFEGKVLFWPFPTLNDFACKYLAVEGCSSASCRFEPIEPRGVDEKLALQLNKHWPMIRAFLNSDKWKSAVRENADITFVKKPAIRLATRIAVTYELSCVTVEEPEGKSSFFDGNTGILWLASKLDADDAAESIGDALQDYFGPEVLREFVCDLFRKNHTKVLEKWLKKGLMLTVTEESPTEDAQLLSIHDTQTIQTDISGIEASIKNRNSNEYSATNVTEDVDANKREPSSITSNIDVRGKNGRATRSAVEPGHRGINEITDSHADSLSVGLEEQQSAKVGIEQPKNDNSGESKWNINIAAITIDVSQALNDAFNKTGITNITDDRPSSGEVRNPIERRKRTRETYATRKSKEPAAPHRVTQHVVDVWDPKNQGVRDFLYEEYSGRCQICDEINRFPRRDGKAYFEAVYLIPHSEAAWTDEPGSVVCLCALCSAKFQHGTVECQDIEHQIHSQKTVHEGGQGQPLIRVNLVGVPVIIKFSERHLIEVQELLILATRSAKMVTSLEEGSTTNSNPND
jgi:hypothetical protein